MTKLDREWTDPRIETLKRLHGDGQSAAQIAPQLGCDFTRNMVAGKIGSLKLPKHPPEVTRQHTTLASRRYAQQQRPGARPPTSPLRAVEPARATDARSLVRLVDLEHHHCRWPIGDPVSDSFGFCGKHRVGLDAADLRQVRPYCAEHCEIAFTGRPIKPAASLGFAHRGMRRAS